ncbi:MAG: hypothetical protein WBF44_08525 [Pseudolabrys sp.]
MPQIRQAGTRTRDLLGYAGSPPDPHWPGGARVAVSIVVNFEEGAEFSISDGDPENEAVYEIEQRLAGRPDPAIDSHFEYGSRAGWWRIMEVLALHGTPVTVSSRPRRRATAATGAGCRAPRPRGFGPWLALGGARRSG